MVEKKCNNEVKALMGCILLLKLCTKDKPRKYWEGYANKSLGRGLALAGLCPVCVAIETVITGKASV